MYSFSTTATNNVNIILKSAIDECVIKNVVLNDVSISSDTSFETERVDTFGSENIMVGIHSPTMYELSFRIKTTLFPEDFIKYLYGDNNLENKVKSPKDDEFTRLKKLLDEE